MCLGRTKGGALALIEEVYAKRFQTSITCDCRWNQCNMMFTHPTQDNTGTIIGFPTVFWESLFSVVVHSTSA